MSPHPHGAPDDSGYKMTKLKIISRKRSLK